MIRTALTALLLLAVLAPPATAAKRVIRGSEWDVRIQAKTTYAYDQPPHRDDIGQSRKGTGSVSAELIRRHVLLPRKRTALGTRYRTRIEGRQTPGPLTYAFLAPASQYEQRCEGRLTNGGGETVYGDQPHVDPLPRTAARELDVTREGITVSFGLLGAYARCLVEGGEMGFPDRERSPFAFDLPGAVHTRKHYRLKAVGWQAYAPCGEQDDFEGAGEPPAVVGPNVDCRPARVARQEITVELTRRCALTTTVVDGSFSYTNCGSSTKLPGL